MFVTTATTTVVINEVGTRDCRASCVSEDYVLNVKHGMQNLHFELLHFLCQLTFPPKKKVEKQIEGSNTGALE